MNERFADSRVEMRMRAQICVEPRARAENSAKCSLQPLGAATQVTRSIKCKFPSLYLTKETLRSNSKVV